MKKVANIFIALAVVAAISFAPVAVHAQVEELEPTDTTGLTETPLPETGGDATMPKGADTGIAPSNKVAQTIAVFAGGSLLGAGLGFGIISLRKKKLDS